MPITTVATNVYEIPFSASTFANVGEDKVGSILAGLSHARLIGPFKFYGDDTRRLRIETSRSPAELTAMFAARGLPQLDVKDIFTVTTSHTQVLDLPREIIFGQPGDRTAGMSARVTAGRKRGDHLRAVT